ncbi:MAG: tripartite tricarboxylate transporter TctB family protein [Aminobacteriaceae bacterium]|nr:tripartite tricarboxylate transporter TctB family protein [Synergistaceae bacterium]
MTRSSMNRLFAAGGLGLSAVLFLGANSFPDRAAAAARYIFFLAGMLAVLSLILLLQRTSSPDSHVRWVRSPKNFTLTLASMVGYGILISFIGFFPASALFMAALSWMLGFRRPVFILLGTGLILGFVWLVFVHFLGVPVPMGIWGE